MAQGADLNLSESVSRSHQRKTGLCVVQVRPLGFRVSQPHAEVAACSAQEVTVLGKVI